MDSELQVSCCLLGVRPGVLSVSASRRWERSAAPGLGPCLLAVRRCPCRRREAGVADRRRLECLRVPWPLLGISRPASVFSGHFRPSSASIGVCRPSPALSGLLADSSLSCRRLQPPLGLVVAKDVPPVGEERRRHGRTGRLGPHGCAGGARLGALGPLHRLEPGPFATSALALSAPPSCLGCQRLWSSSPALEDSVCASAPCTCSGFRGLP